MEETNRNKTQALLERLTRTWWFMILVFLIFFIPPIVQRNGFAFTDFARWFQTIGTIAANNFTQFFLPYSPFFNSIALLVIILVFVLRNKFSRIFSIYVGLMMIFYGITQNSGISKQHGFGIITSGYLLIPILAGFWFWEAAVNKNQFGASPKWTVGKIIALVMAAFAFWNPINPTNALPDFNPLYLLTNGSSTMFCTLTPIVLAIMFLFYPDINSATLRVTGLSGACIGFIQMITNFVVNPAQLWWVGVLHIPIFTLSIAAVVVSFEAEQVARREVEAEKKTVGG